MVTVIIPVYNQKKYIQRCLDSVISQTFNDLEILIIDDGSSDGSEIICDKYARKDCRIRVIHKMNGGLSSARNAGLDICRGEYISFLDSDDYLALDYIEQSLRLCKQYSAEITIMNMVYISENENEEQRNNISETVSIFTAEQAIENSLYQTKFSCCAPGKLYKNNVLKNIRFPLDKLSEDLAVCHEILDNASKIVYSNMNGYYYRQQKASIMHVFNSRRLDALQWTDKIEEFCKHKYPNIIIASKCRTFNVAVHLLLDIPDTDEMKHIYLEKIWYEIKRTRLDVLKCKKARLREKAAAILSYGGEKLLKLVWNSKFAIKQS
ncbi:glycosyltransferase family 2 protein [Lacrimispora sp.]|uniref:glycosyltransferase family 2 protein n=1 Tax=Lacrimispora sp. TaxID=2719234 RepID=UPI002FD88B3A